MSQDPQAPPSAQPLNYQPPTGGYTGPAPTKDDTNMAVLSYILAIFTGFIGPLIIWLLKKEQSQFVNDQGKEVLNWIITVILAMLACIPLMFILIGFLLYPLVLLCHVIFTIMGAVKVSRGIAYRYPFAIRLLK